MYLFTKETNKSVRFLVAPQRERVPSIVALVNITALFQIKNKILFFLQLVCFCIDSGIKTVIAYTPNLQPRFIKSMLEFLEEDLRFDMDEFYKMDIRIFRECAKISKKKRCIENKIT